MYTSTFYGTLGNMRKLLIFACCVALQSCDPYSEAHLCNETKEDSEVVIKIDREFVKTNWEGDQAIHFLKEFAKISTLEELSIDTVLMEGVYKLRAGKCSVLYEGISSNPKFIFNHLTINYRDTSIVYATKDEIGQAFLVTDRGNFKLTIKD